MSTHTIDVNALQSLLPQAVIQFALENSEGKPPLKQAFKTVALFADVSGFTKLSEAFASKGPQGAEELAFFLNRYMEQLVRHIARAGGDVFKFAGDAMLVLWVPGEECAGSQEKIDEEIAIMAHRAVQTSISIQNELDCADLTDGVTLSVKIGIGVGNATVLHAGGVYSRVEYFACGMPLMQAFQSEDKCEKGDIVVSPSVWKLVNDSFDGDIIEDEFVRITNQTCPVRNKSVKASRSKALATAEMHSFQKLLERYIPAAVLPYLTRSQNSWSGELRLVTVLFVNVGVNLSSVQNIDATSLDWIQSVITGIQKAIYKYEGSLNKFLVDDKGSNVIAVFGVPPLAHNDDATRGLLAALKLLRKMRGLGIKCYIGVTSGLVYTGLLGSGTSREYGVLGDAVNLAARLMAKQKKCGAAGVLCDSTTQELIPTDSPIKFEPLEPFYVKGKSEQITAFQPKFTENIVAYKPRSHYFDIECGKKINFNETSAVLIESSIGTGKTYFMESIVNTVTRSYGNEARIVWASGHHYVTAAHAIWSAVFGTLLNKSEFTENRSYRQHVKSLFSNEEWSRMRPYLSLANDIFGTQFLETEKCSYLPDEHRWDKKTECCLALLEEFSKKKKLFILIDNLQWSAPDDWKVTEFVVNMVNQSTHNMNNVVIILAARPLLSALFRPRFEAAPEEYDRLKQQFLANKQLITTDCWNLFQIKEFMTEFFAVDDITPCLAHFVYERSGGNQAFATWICDQLELNITACDDLMLLEMSEKTEQSITSEAPLQHPVPIKVHSTLMGYIDRLTPSQILLLKTASVICMGQGSGSIIFDQASVAECYPVSEYRDSVESDLQHLAAVQIIHQIPHSTPNFDTFSSNPNFFAHNHQWMVNSSFLSIIGDVSTKGNNIFSKKLIHFYLNRVVLYQFDIDKGANWNQRHVIPFNDPAAPITLRRISSSILSIDNEQNVYNIRANSTKIDDLFQILDDSLSRGITTEEREKQMTYDVELYENTLYSFGCGFFRDVIYGLMLLKQRQQLHDNAAKFLSQRWTDQIHSQFRSKVLARHRDLALKDDTLRRMGSFYQAAPQHHQTQSDRHNANRSTITSFYRAIKPKGDGQRRQHRIATLSPANNKKLQSPSIFTRLRQSLAVHKTVPS